MLRSDFCDYSDAYIVVKETIDFLALAANENDKAEKNVAFKNNAPFRSFISKINSTLIGNGKDLDTVMQIYNLLEYNQNHYLASRSLRNYYWEEIDNINDNALDGKSLKRKTKTVVKTPEQPGKVIQIDQQYQF